MTHRRTLLHLLLAGGAAAALPASASAAGVRELDRRKLDGDLDGREAVWLEVTYPPGASSAPHRHAGEVFGFVIEGRFRFSVRGQEERILGPGDTFFEPFDAIHQTSANIGDGPVRLAVLMLAEAGRPLTEAA